MKKKCEVKRLNKEDLNLLEEQKTIIDQIRIVGILHDKGSKLEDKTRIKK